MKTKLIVLMMLIAGTVAAQNKLTVSVDGIKDVKGRLFVGVYEEDNFLKNPEIGTIVKIEDSTLTIQLDNIPSGDYAVAIFQDENDNGELDMGSNGIPVERYGFSNYANGEMGAPSFENCKFRIEDDVMLHVTLISYSK